MIRITFTKHRVMAGLAACLLAGALAHGIGLKNGFVWDDHYYVIQNRGIRSWRHLPEHFHSPDLHMGGLNTQIWRPVRNISYTLDYTFSKLNPFGYHMTNLILHGLNACLLLLLIRRLTERVTPAVVGALLFAVHPVLTETVAWVKGRDDLLALAFFLAGLLIFLRNPTRRGWAGRHFFMLLFLLLALLSKESALCLVPTAGLMWLALRKKGRGAFIPREAGTILGIGLLMTGLYVGIRTLVVGRLSQTDWITGSAGSTLLTMVPVTAQYLRLAVLPVNLVCDYSDFPVVQSVLDPSFLLSLAFLILLGVGLNRMWRRASLVTLGFAWFFLNLVPVLNLVPTMQLMAERFLYIPMAGFCMAVGCGFARADSALVGRRAMRGCLRITGSSVLILLMVLTFLRTRDWRNDSVLFETALCASPGNARVRDLAATAAADRGDHRRVLELLAGQVSETSGSAKAKRNLGCAFFAAGRKDEGEKLLRAAIRQDPSLPQPYEDMAKIALSEDDKQEAVKWFAAAVKRESFNDTRWLNLGLACRNAGEIGRARRALEVAIRLNGANINALRALVSLAWARGEWQVCRRCLERILKVRPDDADARHWLEKVHEKLRTEKSRYELFFPISFLLTPYSEQATFRVPQSETTYAPIV